MTQPKSMKSPRQSDLQPLYNVVDALQPAHIKAVYNGLDRRTRGTILITLASVVLVWALFTILNLAIQHVKDTSGPFLLDALKAPYNLDARLMPLPPTDQSSILPGTVGDYSLVDSPYQATPVPPVTGKDGKVVEAAPQTPAIPISAPLAACLVTAIDGAAPTNCTGFNALITAAGDYHNTDGTALNMTMALFTTHAEASNVMRKLQQQTASNGHTGDFAIGVTSVDYFYSSQSQLYMFSWANGPWVYTASSSSFDELEKFVAQFPY